MFEYRVTKYDPARRDDRGRYLRDEWTSIRDIGRQFADGVLTNEEYGRVEEAYAATAVAFLHESGVSALWVDSLENHRQAPLSFAEGSSLGLAEISDVVRRLLREEFWCRLESKEAFLHVGYDYYLYVGVSRECPRAIAETSRLGLFVEPWRSPYHRRIRRDSDSN